MLRDGSSERWEIHGRFVIEAESEEQATRAIEALERTGKRVKANVTIHTHVSEAVEGR